MADGRDGRRGHLFSYAAGVGALTMALVAGVAVTPGGGGPGLAMTAYSQVGTNAAGSRLALLRAAAREFGVPVRLLLAISYNETRWERQSDSPTLDAGYGLMDLTAKTFPTEDGRGDPSRPVPPTVTLAWTHDTLNEAARLLHASVMTLKTNDRQNVRGAAALLAHYARKLTGGSLPASL